MADLAAQAKKALDRKVKAAIKKAESGYDIRIGFFDEYGKNLESGHREGVNEQPKRPIIPTGNEAFAKQVVDEIKKKLVSAYKVAIRKDKKIPRREYQEAGENGVEKIKALVSRGISPIKGRGRFPGYKNPDKYPGERKRRRPVNLKLTGKFLKKLKVKVSK